MIWVVFCAAAGCQGNARVDEPLVLAWGQPLITRKGFHGRVARQALECVQSAEPACVEIRKNLLAQMIDEALLLKHAAEQGLKIPEALLVETEQSLLRDYQGAEDTLKMLVVDRKQWRVFLKERLMIQSVLEQISQGVDVEAEEVVAYFRDHRELFVRQREVRVRQIVLGQGAEAQDLLARIRKGESFSALAKKHSLGPEAAAGGEMGFLRPHDAPPELEDVIFSLEKGKVSEILPSPQGFHIVRVEEERAPREMEYTEVQEEIRQQILREKIQSRQKAWLEAQWKEADVQILDQRLKKGAVEGERMS